MAVCSIRNVAIFWSAIFLGVSYFLYSPVPNGFAEPWRLRTILAGFKVVALTGVISEKLGYESSINFTRRALEMAYYPTSKNDPELKVTDTLFDGVSVRIYQPINLKTPAPALVYFHGGGWVLLSVDSYDVLTSHIAKGADIIVISVDYRRAPEHPFPIPFDDCVTATIHLLQNAAKYGVDPSRVAIGGDSAGGNLAAAVSLKLRDSKLKPKIKHQILVYPSLQFCDWQLPSYSSGSILFGPEERSEFITSYANLSKHFKPILNTEESTSKGVRDACKQLVNFKLLPQKYIPKDYTQTESFANGDSKDFKKAQKFFMNPYAAPLMSLDLGGLPPTLLLSVEYDTLRDENAIFVARLKSAHVNVVWEHFEHCIHGCFNMRKSNLKEGQRMVESVINYIRNEL